MKTKWLIVFLASIFEVLWVIGLAHAYNAFTWLLTIVAIILSNYLLIKASEVLPAGTVYTVFVGLGTAGTVISEMIFFGEPFKLSKILLIFILLLGVVGLKTVTDKEEREEV